MPHSHVSSTVHVRNMCKGLNVNVGLVKNCTTAKSWTSTQLSRADYSSAAEVLFKDIHFKHKHVTCAYFSDLVVDSKEEDAYEISHS